MKLDPSERSILAAFRTDTAAEQVRKKLEPLGFTCQIDRTSVFGGTPHDRDLNNPIANEALTLSGLTLYEGQDRTPGNVGPLLATHPAASGQSGPPLDSHNYLLTAVGPPEKVKEALRLIRAGGGQA